LTGLKARYKELAKRLHPDVNGGDAEAEERLKRINLAYATLQHDVFDILLTDIVMPEMDGIELARRAAELDPTLKIMFITGFAAVALNPESETPKDAKVLSKPFHLRDLVDEVDRLMAA